MFTYSVLLSPRYYIHIYHHYYRANDGTGIEGEQPTVSMVRSIIRGIFKAVRKCVWQ